MGTLESPQAWALRTKGITKEAYEKLSKVEKKTLELEWANSRPVYTSYFHPGEK